MDKKEYLLKLNNNLAAKIFIWFLKKNLNRKSYSLVLRGRHSDRKKLYEELNRRYISGSA